MIKFKRVTGRHVLFLCCYEEQDQTRQRKESFHK